MTPDDANLERLRQNIDRIDDRLHDLLMERASLVEQIAAAKPAGGVPLRPGREAFILRRLLNRHKGHFPKTSLIRIWREIMGALVGMQAPFTVAVAEPEKGAGYAALARDHFGVSWPHLMHQTAGQVVRAVADGVVSVGVVPLPSPADTDPWWLSLTATADNLPRVVARLASIRQESPGIHPQTDALVIACRPHDPSGEDRSLLAVETSPDLSRDRLRILMDGVGLASRGLIATHRSEEACYHLIEVEGHVVDGDARLIALVVGHDPIRHVRVGGGYAVPLPL